MGPPKSKTYFAYLTADIPASAEVLKGLAASGLQGQAYLRGAHPSLKADLRQAGVDLLDAPASMEQVLAERALIVHHGGVGTSQQAAAAGRPQVLVPWHLEQGCNAAVLEGCGLGRRLTGAGEAADVVGRLLDEDDSMKKAQAFARLVQARSTGSALEAVASGCEQHLGPGA
jgi:UDP-N-acetylglucosamine:LPS N-acetylglucosamine transferase